MEEIKYTKDFTENLIETSNAIVIGLDINGKIIIFNKAAEILTGYKKSEVIGQDWFQLMIPKEMRPNILEEFEKVKNSKIEEDFQNPILTKDNQIRHILWKNNEIKENGEIKGTISFGIDITERKEIEDELIRTEEELRQANSTKDKFFSIIAHDLREPIGNLMQIANILAERCSDVKYKKIIDSQRNISRNTFYLLENLLHWAKFNNKNLDYEPELLNINEIIEDNIDIETYRANKKEIIILTTYTEQFQCFADKNMVDLIIRNLLSNAIKFTKDKGKIVIDMYYEDDFLKIEITDSGVGISKENIEKILDDKTFYTTLGTQNEKGNGLGLQLCKNFINLNKGQFQIKSTVDKGSTFSFTLPRH